MRVEEEALKLPAKHASNERMLVGDAGEKSRYHSSYERGCQEQTLLHSSP
jgi:hypothetical protein